VVTLGLPPLRERQGDTLLLANAFLQRFSRELKKKVSGFSQPAVSALEAHPWTGNIRELENHIKRAVIMAEGSRITPADLELESNGNGHGSLTLKEAREQVERTVILEALAQHKHNLTRTAEKLGISRPTLYEMMDKLGIARK